MRRKLRILSTFMLTGLTLSNLAYAMPKEPGDSKIASYELGHVIIEEDKKLLAGSLMTHDARMGLIGNKSILNVPYSLQGMSERAINTFGDSSLPLANVLINNPSIRASSSSPMYTDFSLRGINMNGNHFMLNGVPSLFYQFTTPPGHIIERLDISSGPNAAVNGVSMSNNGTNSGATPAPGTINVITKRAYKEPITQYKQTFSGRGSFGEYIDIARRFGKEGECGIRINGEMLKGELSLPGAKNKSQNIFLNADYKGKNSSTNIFAGYWDLRVDGGQRWFTYGGNKTTLPSAPNAKMNYDYPETTKWMYMHVLTLNHQQRLADNWQLFLNGGFSRREGNKFNSQANLRFDNNGSFMSNNRANAQDEAAKNSYVQVGVAGEVYSGAVKHELSLAVDRSWARYWNANSYSATGLYGGNLYDGISFAPGLYPLPKLANAKPQWRETNVGITLMDYMTYDKWHIMLAASQKHENFENFTNKKIIRNNNILPTFGITYKPTENTAIYYGHTESFSRGYVVTNAGYKNVGETLSPVKSKQNEIGVKYENKGMRTTLSLFEIDEANRFDFIDSSGDKWYKADGKNEYRGIELTANGKPHAKWTVTGGLLYLEAKRAKTQNGSKDGFFVNGTAKLSGVLGLVYNIDDKLSLIGRSVYCGKSHIDSDSPDRRTKIPSALTFDLGVKYNTHINRTPVEFTLMCFNATNKSYWMGRGASTTFGLSMPRTWMLSADISL